MAVLMKVIAAIIVVSDDNCDGNLSVEMSNTDDSDSSVDSSPQLSSVRGGHGQKRGCGRGSRGRGIRGRGMRGRGSRGQSRGHGRRGVAQSSTGMPTNCTSITVKDTTFSCSVTEDDFCPLREPGPHIPSDVTITPLALFQLFFDEYVVKQIIESTLAYAEQKKNDLVNSYCKFINKLLTKAELFCYLGAWSIKKAQYLVRLSELLTCERFELIGTFLHLVTPEEEQVLSGNKLSKILPLHNYMKAKSAELYQPSRNLSVDERMVKGKDALPHYIRNKPTKWGFKYWVLADVTGYTVDFDLYIGKAAQSSSHGLGFDVVMKLMEPYWFQGYEVFLDNFYTILLLA